MLSTIHEYLGVWITNEIEKQLEEIRSGSNAAALLAEKILCGGSTSIYLEDDAQHDPDKQFVYEDERYLGLIIEIGYSQRKKNLLQLADDYITMSEGRIQMVIGVELDYRGTKSAMLKVWCPHYGSDEGEDYVESKEVLSEVWRS